MKKKTLGIIIAAAVAVAAAGTVLALTLAGRGMPGHGNIENIDWYNEKDKEFIITDVDMLYDVATLSNHYDFAGQTLKLGADITVNTGFAEEWEENAPSRPWKPIRAFAGTFDGQGHTISGLYARTANVPTAMFTNVTDEAVIRDFRLVNTLFLTSGNMGSAAVAANCAGTYQQIYSDAIVRAARGAAGGIISHQTGNIVIEECWFDGALSTEYRNIGGMADCADGAELVVRHCLNTGAIYAPYSNGADNAGGLVGMTYNGARLVVEDSFSSGTMELGNMSRSGSAVGGGDANSTATLANVFAVMERFPYTVSTIIYNKVGGAAPIVEKNTLGVKAYQWMNLDFENHWACRENDVPVPVCFAEHPMDLTGVQRAVDYAWYDSTADELHIRNLAQLYAFGLLSYTDSYEGKTIYLDEDIEVNAGLAADWIEKEPENRWYPVQYFAGALDGQGHTISGVYAEGSSAVGFISIARGTAGVRDLRLMNSLIKVSGGDNGAALSGSVIGRGGGSLDGVYSNAIVYSEGYEIGGLIGQINLTGVITTINNCWYDGQLILKGDTNGFFAGGLVGGHALGTLNITHSLFSGVIHTEVNKGSRAGGFIGSVMNTAVANIGDCLNTGTMDTLNGNWVGGAVGNVATEAKVSIKQSYSSRESVKNSMGEYVSHTSVGDAPRSEGAVIPVYESNLIGANAYRWTDLSIGRFWALRPDNTPVPKVFYKDETVSTDGLSKMFSTDWYTPGEGGVIYSAADYIGFNMLSWTTDFAGETIRLGADVTLNSGSASSWLSSAPAIRSIPMASFAGTFDGGMHTISGVYQRDYTKLGLFSQTRETTVVRNLRLVNSCFDSTGYVYGNVLQSRSGSVVAQGGGTLDTIYSDAIIRSNGQVTGGIIAWVYMDTDNRMNNLWFDGSITATDEEYGYFAGGIVGGTVLGRNRVDHCLFTGSIQTAVSNKASKVGGIVGSVQNDNSLTVTDCLSAGTVTCGNQYYKGAIVGVMYPGNPVKIVNCFADKDSTLDKYGQFVSTAKNDQVKADELSGSAMPLAKELLTGVNAYRWTSLDFDNYWAARSNDYPGLKSFVGSPLDTSSAQRMLDISWYDADADSLTVDSMQDLYGLQALSYSTNFAGQTVKLGADITINSGSAADWADKAPENLWTPINNFAGTLDGQGHTVSGLYGKSDTSGLGLVGKLSGTVKNLRVENSLLTGSGGDVGAIVGCIQDGGTVDSVYSDAIIKATGGSNYGGLVGAVRNTAGHNDKASVTNSWFSGRVEAENSYNISGLVGVVVHDNSLLEMDNCLMSGSVVTPDKRTVGGALSRTMNNSNARLSNVLVSGSVSSAGGGQTGSVLGFSNGNTVLTNVYASASAHAVGVGTGAVNGKVQLLADGQLKGTGGYQNTKLDFTQKPYWTAVEDNAPVLRSHYSGAALDLTNVVRLDTDWYDPDKDTLVIRTLQELLTFANVSKNETFAGQTVLLDADLDLNPDWTASAEAPAQEWIMAGGRQAYFQGTFDGQGHTISGIYVNNASDIGTGFFGWIDNGAEIRNLTLGNSYFLSSYVSSDNVSRAGAIVGHVSTGGAGGVLRNVTVLDTVTVEAAGMQTGGLVGATMGGLTVDHCTMAATVKGGTVTGGIVGGIVNAAHTGAITITNCTVTGPISGSENVGGLVGQMGRTESEALTVSDCAVSSAITGAQRLAGLFGYVNNGAANVLHVSGCVSSADVTGSAKPARTGGLFGMANGGILQIENSRFDGSLTQPGANLCGGIVAQSNGATIRLTDCVSVGSIEAGGMAGTLVGYVGAGSAVITDSLGLISGVAKTVCSGVAANMTVDNSVAIPAGAETAAEQTFTVSTADQLALIAELSEYSGYKGITLQLGADIDLNPDWTASSTAPEKVWTAIGSETTPFGGTLNGAGHTVSGLYVSGGDAGLIGWMNGGTVTDLHIANSFISGTTAGAVAGCVDGQSSIRKVYADATVTGQTYGGGLAGAVASTGRLQITSCLVTGTVSGADFAGGLLGGAAASGAQTDVYDTLVTGQVTSSGGQAGALIGSTTSLTASLKNTCATAESCASGTQGIGQIGENTDNDAQIVAAADILGENGCLNTPLDFSGAWGAVKDAAPVLKEFYDGELLDVSELIGTVVSISTADQLIAFAAQSKADDFTGKTVKLTADIDLNPAWTASSTAPETVWGMIGSAETPFAGTFDGQGHTVSGVYVQNTDSEGTGFFAWLDGAEVKALTLSNSYFGSTAATASAGAVAGAVKGAGATLQSVTVTDSVTVSAAGKQVGGLAGLASGKLTAQDCTVAGSVTGLSHVGGLVGQLTAADSLFSGCEIGASVYASNASGQVASAGGVAGNVTAAGTKVADVRVTGTVSSAGSYDVGGVFGNLNASGTVEKSQVSAEVFMELNSTNVGGIAGSVRGTSTLTVTETEFSGYVHSAASQTGGGGRIGGYVGTIMNAGSAAVITDCVMSGRVITDKKMSIGGITSMSYVKGSSCTVTRTLITGVVQSAGGDQTGAVAGNTANLKVTVQDVYVLDTACAVGTNGAGTTQNMVGTVTVLTAAQLKDEAAATNAPALDYETVWQTGDVPVLRALQQ